MRTLETLEWRYMAGGKVRHAMYGSGFTEAMCGVYVVPASEWRGTGSQDEYERNARLPNCRRCMKILSPRRTQ